MAVFKCKMCGGELHIDGTDKVVTCEYCGTAQTVPAADNEKKLTLFNRANRLRMNSEFDKAAGLYENIVAEFPEEAEAYWGLCLCNYGIEYVDDPATGQKKPTCHRASFQKLTEDENYKLAMEYADVVARRVYRDEAREIDRINEEILALSRNEAPYDVFICYKETDDAGNRTPESVLSQDIYEALTAKGFKVFFSRVTLEDKLGMQYEPYIFAALNSAKVMLCVGTRYEHFHAVWVRNEWGRFLRLAAKDKRKVLIPCYKDMNPYDLPDEFKGLQAQDLGKLGALQDLTRGVEKILAKPAPTAKRAAQPVAVVGAPITKESLLKRAYAFLEDGDWQNAAAYAEKVLDVDVETAEAHLVKLLAEAHAHNRAELKNCPASFESSPNYQKAMRYGDEALKTELAETLRFITDRNETARKDLIYARAEQKLKKAKTEKSFTVAKELFSSISGYMDAASRAEECETAREEIIYKHAKKKLKEAETENEFAAAKELFRSITGYKDADARAEECETAQNKIIYNQAEQELKEAETEDEFTAAAERFHSISGYMDAASRAEECETARNEFIYNRAEQKLKEAKKESEFAAAKELFISISGYKDADERANEVRQKAEEQRAEAWRKKRKRILLISAVVTVVLLIDGLEMLNTLVLQPTIKYNDAVKLMQDGKYSEAISAFEALNGYKDSAAQIEKAKTLVLKNAKVGDSVWFGSYEQDNDAANGKEAIEWQVLAREGNQVLVLSKYALDCQPYNTSVTDVTWETCSLRTWLNGTFLNAAFSAEEQKMIPTVTVTADKNPEYGTDPGQNTNDKVFLLSITEVNKYFSSNEARICGTTDYAKAQGAYTISAYSAGGKAACRWWLRSLGYYSFYAAFVDRGGDVGGSGGGIYEYGSKVDYSSSAVRPALWIDVG